MMKAAAHVLITLAALAGLGYVLMLGLSHEAPAEADEHKPAAAQGQHEDEKAEDYVVELEKDRVEALGLEVGKPSPHHLAPRRMAYGAVLDLAPMIATDGDLTLAEAAVKASAAVNERTQALAASNDASRKNAEAADAQYRADQIKLRTLQQAAHVQWGGVFPVEERARHAWMESLAAGRVALLRADLAGGPALDAAPPGAQIQIVGHEDSPLQAAKVMLAPVADAKTQAQSFLIRVDAPPFTLQAGLAATVWLNLPGEQRAGFILPRSSVLRHDGRAWVYVQEEAGKYERKPVIIDSPQDDGLFVADGGELKSDETIVVRGAASLLSEELKGAGGEPE